MNRREFLQDTLAAMAVGVIVPAAFRIDSSAGASTQDGEAPRITAIVFDERYRDSRAFAAALVAHGAKPFAVDGNSAAIWHGPLRAHLAAAPGRVAGLTTESDRGVSFDFGRELRLRPICQGAHDARRSSQIAHCIRAAGRRYEIAAALRDSNESWPNSLAMALHRCQLPFASRITSLQAPVAVSHDLFVVTSSSSGDFPGYLTSWLLAPRAAG